MNAYTFWKELDTLSETLSDGLLSSISSPRVDVVETKDHYELVAELPGFNKDEVTIQVKDGVLELNAKQPEAKADAEAQWLLRERRKAAFQRTFRLPRDVDGEAIEAAFQDGLLVLTLPKREETKPRTVAIKAA
jgi:HSP20 family molecular chaperone IbpA